MATQNPKLLPGLKANGDLSDKQYHFVKLVADHTVGNVAAVTDKALGVLQNDPSSAGEDASVANGGTSKVKTAAAVALNAAVAPAADGRAQTAVATQFPMGKALQAAAGADEIIEIELTPSEHAI